MRKSLLGRDYMIVTAINNYDIHNLIKQEYGEDVYK